MSTFFQSDWEAGTGILDSVWTGDSGTLSILSVATDQFFSGAHSLKCIQASHIGFIYKNFTAIPTIGMRFAVRIHTAPSFSIPMAELGGGPMTKCWLTATTFYYDSDSVGTPIGTPFTFSIDTWYQIEVFYTNSNSALAWRVWNAGGTTILAGPYSGTAKYPSTIGAIDFGSLAADVATFWLDALVADNAAYPGPIVKSFYPFPSFNPSY
jgi:hypothetical protein